MKRIKQENNIKGLIKALCYKKDWLTRQTAAEALCKIGDHQATEPLIAALKEGTYEVQKAAAEVLEKLGWQPNQGETGAIYWIIKEEWKKRQPLDTWL